MEWVEEKILELETHKESLERSIRTLKAMFKPWSSHISLLDHLPTPASTSVSPADGPVQADVAILSPEEEAGIAMVERVLSKAQKARAVQQRLEDPKKSKPKVCAEKKNPPAISDDSSKPALIPDCELANKDNANSVISDTRTTNHQTDYKQQITTTRMGNTESGNKVTHASGKSDRSQRSGVSHRPQSASGHRKITGAHTSAPFQTNPRNNVSGMQTTYRTATTSVIRKSKQEKENSALGAKRKPVKSATVNNSSISSQNGVNDKQGKQYMDSKLSSAPNVTEFKAETKKTLEGPLEGINTEARTNPKQKTHITVESNCESAVEGVCKLNLSEQVSGTTTVKQESDLKLFSLAKNGKELKVPVRLKKLVHKYNKLRLKLCMEKLTQKVDTHHPASTFLSHVEQTFAAGGDVLCQLQARQVLYLLNLYTNLLDMVDSLHLDTISETSHPADVLRAKLLMEYVLTMYQETETLLHQSDFSALKSANILEGDVKTLSPSDESTSEWVWYSPGRISEPRSPACLQYSSYRDLEHYMSAVFRLQMLKLQRDTQRHMASEVLPLLESLDPTSSDYIQVLRASYSMLSRNPSRMPVIIQDTIGGDETVEEKS